MVQMLQQLVNGLILGSVCTLALGYAHGMELSNWSNFAHGDIYMVGAFMGYLLNSHGKWTSLCLLLGKWLGQLFLGVVIEFGLSVRFCHLTGLLPDHSHRGFLLAWIWDGLQGANTRSFPQVIKTVRYNFGPISISNIQLMIWECLFSWWSLFTLLFKDKDGESHAGCIRCR